MHFIACSCNDEGARGVSCDDEGKCQCKRCENNQKNRKNIRLLKNLLLFIAILMDCVVKSVEVDFITGLLAKVCYEMHVSH